MTPPPTAPALADWTDLTVELDRWATAGKQASFWWRDDDAVAWTPALQRLLALAGPLPVALAPIPGEIEPGLPEALANYPAVGVLQHGWRHANHAPEGEKKAEYGTHRPLAQRLQELIAGRDRIRALFGARALPVLVPPWNRLGADLPPALPGIGITGLSVDRPRASAEPVKGLCVVNIHVDLGPLQSGAVEAERTVLGQMLRHLTGRRTGAVDASEPTGLLTHHRVQDGRYENFLRRFLAIARKHAAACFPPIAEIFQPT